MSDDEKPDLAAVLEWRRVSEWLWVSDQGHVWSQRAGRLLKGTRNADGYRLCWARGRRTYIHILVLEAFVGPRPSGAVARHLNDIPGDDRAVNLAWGTRADNVADFMHNKRGVVRV